MTTGRKQFFFNSAERELLLHALTFLKEASEVTAICSAHVKCKTFTLARVAELSTKLREEKK